MIWDFVKAFLVGGFICMLCQIIIDRTKLTPARILVGLVTSGVILSAVVIACAGAVMLGQMGLP